MENKKTKKIVLILLLLLIIIVATVIISLKIYNNQKINEVKQLMEKTLTYSNYYYQTTNNLGQTVIKKVKDNVMLHSIDDTVITWKNYNTNECIVLSQGNAIIYENVDDYLGDGLSQIYSKYKDFNETEHKIKYVGKEEIDGKKCLVVESTNKANNKKNTLWIDQETGVLYKWITYENDNVIEFEANYKVELNTMTDADVAKPDLTGYNVVNAE